jgi:hypothetical protein
MKDRQKSSLIPILILLALTLPSLCGSGTDILKLQDAASMNSIIAFQASLNTEGNAIFNRQNELNNPAAAAAYAASKNNTANIIKARKSAMLKQG